MKTPFAGFRLYILLPTSHTLRDPTVCLISIRHPIPFAFSPSLPSDEFGIHFPMLLFVSLCHSLLRICYMVTIIVHWLQVSPTALIPTFARHLRFPAPMYFSSNHPILCDDSHFAHLDLGGASHPRLPLLIRLGTLYVILCDSVRLGSVLRPDILHLEKQTPNYVIRIQFSSFVFGFTPNSSLCFVPIHTNPSIPKRLLDLIL